MVDIFISGNARINMQSPFWGESSSNVFEYMRRDTEHFMPYKIFVAHSVSTIESQMRNADLQRGLIVRSLKMGDINPKANDPQVDLAAYAYPSHYQDVLEGVRREFTVRLLNLFPSVDNG
jgi:hypothetical protein